MTACGSRPERHVAITPPAALLMDCPETRVQMVVNGDLVYKVRSLRMDLKRCNADKAELRAWSKELTPKK